MRQQSSRYNYSLRGTEALRWLAERGMAEESEDEPDIRLVADEILQPELRMTRLWHTGASYRVTCHSSSALLLLQIEGVASVDSAPWDTSAALGPGDVALLPGGAHSFRFSSTSPTARYELGYDLDALPMPVRDELSAGRVFTAPTTEYRDAVAATSNAALNSGMSAQDAGFSDFKTGLQYLMTALLLQALETTSPWLMTPSSVLHRGAMRVISSRAADPEFDVEMLAEAIRTSSRNLRYVFAQAGSTAKESLTAERVRIAEVYLSRNTGGASFALAEIARLSGFRDVRALRRALAKFGERVLPSDSGEGSA